MPTFAVKEKSAVSGASAGAVWRGLRNSIEEVSIETLKYHPKNPRAHNEKNITGIMASIKRAALLAPLVVWGKDNFVIVGNGRLEALRRLGRKTVEIVRADHLTADQAEIHMIEDNKLTDMSTWNPDTLAELMGSLAERGVDLTETGFEPVEIEPILCPVTAEAAEPEGAEGGAAEPGVETGEKIITCPHCQGEIILGGELENV